MDNYIGIAPDNRSAKEKKKDYPAEELASSVELKWKEKKRWKSYSERNQAKTNSCVAQSVSKMLEVLNKNETGKTVVFSASPIYAKRWNRPEAGMSLFDVFDIVKKHGTTLESRIQSQNLKSDKELEEKANTWVKEDDNVAHTYGIEAYAFIRDYNIDTIASYLEQGLPVILFVYAQTDEYLEFPKVKYPELKHENAYIRHAVVAVDYGLINGKKYLKIEDSAHFAKKSVRFFDDTFISTRVYGAGVLFDRDNSAVPKKIKHTFNKDLVFGMMNDPDVKKLQDILKKEGLFPIATPSTGNYLEITRKAVDEFQVKYQVASLYELLIVKGKRVGKKTRDFLNEKYA